MDYDIVADEPVSTAVVRAVSAVVGREPRSLRPLGEILDPAALDGLFSSQDGGAPRVGGRLSFVYGDCRVTVDSGEYLTVQPLEPHARPPRERDSSQPKVR